MSRMFRPAKYWVGTVSREHGMNAVSAGIVQVCHGKEGPLKRMQAGDWFVYYSSKEKMSDKQSTVQRFVSIGRVLTGDVYQVEQFPGFKPFRIDVEFMQCKEANIRPLIARLDFIRNKEKWGSAFRFGCIEASEKDLRLIAGEMGVDIDRPVPAAPPGSIKRLPAIASAGKPKAGKSGSAAGKSSARGAGKFGAGAAKRRPVKLESTRPAGVSKPRSGK